MTTAALTALEALPEYLLSAAQVGEHTYEIVDVDARTGVLDNRDLIDEISGLIQGGVHYIGKTTTTLADGSTLSVIEIGGVNVTAEQGDMVSMEHEPQDLEFIFNGTTWYELGSTGSLKALAFKDSVSASYTPAGSVELTNSDVTADLNGGAATAAEITGLSASTTATYTPQGSVSTSYTPAGSVDIADIEVGDKTISVTTVSAASFAGTEISVEASFTGETSTLTAGFTGTSAEITSTINSVYVEGSASGELPALPSLSASAPAVSVTTGSTNVLNTASVTDGVLSFGSTSVLSDATAALESAPAVGYAEAYTNEATFSLTAANTDTIEATGTYTPAGTISVESYTPVGTITTTEFAPSGDITLSTGTEQKTISIGTLSTTGSFTGTSATISADLSGTEATINGSATVENFTPSITAVTGSVTVSVPSSAAFSGTAATITST